MERKRQTLIPDWNQEAIRNVRLLVAGGGALGSQAVVGATRFGIGHITVADFDVLEEHNLENQVYDASDVGKPKVLALQERARRIDPAIRVDTFQGRIQDYRGTMDHTIMLGCLDNVAARHWLNYLSVKHEIPLIDAGILAFLGTVTTILPGQTACYSCQPFLPRNPPRASCSESPLPTTYATAAIVANLQILQLVKLVHKKPIRSHLMVDLAQSRMYEHHFAPNPSCEICGSS